MRTSVPPTSRRIAAVALAVVCCTAVGCGGWSRDGREPIAGDMYGLEIPQRIEGPQLLHTWNGEWVGDHLTFEAVGSTFPRGAELTLQLTASRPESTPPSAAGAALGEELGRALLDIQNQGALVRGVHLELEPMLEVAEPIGLEELNEWLRSLRSSLGREFELSWSVPWLEPSAIGSELESIGQSVNWTSIKTYGQAPGSADVPSLWDLAAAESRLEAAAASGVPFRSLIRVGGSVSRRSDRNLALLGSSLPCDVFQELAGRSESFFQFEGYFRQVFEADPKLRVLRIGDQEVSVGDRLRVNRTTVGHLRTLLARIDDRGGPSHLGHLFVDMTSDPADCLALDLEELALATSPPARWPQVNMEKFGKDRYRMEVLAGSETTGLARAKNNFVEVIADEGTILDVEMQGFVRFEFINRQREVAPGLLGTGVRIYVPLLEADQTASATIRTRAHRTGFELTPRFISPTGEPLPLNGSHWTEGGNEVAAEGSER